MGLEEGEGRGEPAKRPKKEGRSNIQWQCPAQHCSQRGVSYAEDGCLRPSPPIVNKPFFQTLDCGVVSRDAAQVLIHLDNIRRIIIHISILKALISSEIKRPV